MEGGLAVGPATLGPRRRGGRATTSPGRGETSATLARRRPPASASGVGRPLTHLTRPLSQRGKRGERAHAGRHAHARTAERAAPQEGGLTLAPAPSPSPNPSAKPNLHLNPNPNPNSNPDPNPKPKPQPQPLNPNPNPHRKKVGAQEDDGPRARSGEIHARSGEIHARSSEIHARSSEIHARRADRRAEGAPDPYGGEGEAHLDLGDLDLGDLDLDDGEVEDGGP